MYPAKAFAFNRIFWSFPSMGLNHVCKVSVGGTFVGKNGRSGVDAALHHALNLGGLEDIITFRSCWALRAAVQQRYTPMSAKRACKKWKAPSTTWRKEHLQLGKRCTIPTDWGAYISKLGASVKRRQNTYWTDSKNWKCRLIKHTHWLNFGARKK